MPRGSFRHLQFFVTPYIAQGRPRSIAALRFGGPHLLRHLQQPLIHLGECGAGLETDLSRLRMHHGAARGYAGQGFDAHLNAGNGYLEAQALPIFFQTDYRQAGLPFMFSFALIQRFQLLTNTNQFPFTSTPAAVAPRRLILQRNTPLGKVARGTVQ